MCKHHGCCHGCHGSYSNDFVLRRQITFSSLDLSHARSHCLDGSKPFQAGPRMTWRIMELSINSCSYTFSLVTIIYQWLLPVPPITVPYRTLTPIKVRITWSHDPASIQAPDKPRHACNCQKSTPANGILPFQGWGLGFGDSAIPMMFIWLRHSFRCSRILCVVSVFWDPFKLEYPWP